MHMETALAKASLTRVERRDPYKLKHKMDLAALKKLAPNFDWDTYYADRHYPSIARSERRFPSIFQAAERRLNGESLDDWKTYLRFHVADSCCAVSFVEIRG